MREGEQGLLGGYAVDISARRDCHTYTSAAPIVAVLERVSVNNMTKSPQKLVYLGQLVGYTHTSLPGILNAKRTINRVITVRQRALEVGVEDVDVEFEDMDVDVGVGAAVEDVGTVEELEGGDTEHHGPR